MHRILLLVAAVGVVTGQNQNEQDLRDVANSNNDFTTSLFKSLKKTIPGNLIFSPFSLSSAMAMVKAGAKGVTADEIQRGMHFPSDDRKLFNGYKQLISTLESNDNFTLETANAIYSQDGFALNPKYKQILEENFKAQATQLDFSKKEEAAGKINGFVKRVTKNKIDNLVSANDFDALTRLVLVNAIYFKGLWANKFDPDNTKQAPFYTSENESVTVDMMKSETDYPYVDLSSTLDAKAIALPYKGNRLSMIILLPNKVGGLADLEKKLQEPGSIRLADIPERMRTRKITLFMPKFKLETTIDLASVLKDLGMKSMFSDTADFGEIPAPGSNEQLQVSKAVQKAFIEVNEEGSEAAAATGLQLQLKSAFMGTVLRANHPFLSMIYDNQTSSILFLDTVFNPKIESTASPAPENLRDNSANTCTVSLFLISTFIIIRQSLMAFLS